MRTLKEIDTAITEKRTMLADDKNLDKVAEIETDVNALLDERKQVVDAIEKRKTLLAGIASGAAGVETRGAAGEVEKPAAEDKPADPLGTAEYRSAFYKSMTGRKLSEKEQRALEIATEARGMSSASDSAGPAVPTQIADDIVQKVKQVAPMLSEITLFRINGNLTVAVEDSISDADLHTENATITEGTNKLVKVTLGGYEITKLVTISKTVATMTQGNFESWLVEMIAKRVARVIENYIINGTGSDQPKGVAAAATWADGTNQITVAKASFLTADNINALIALLNGEYDYNAKILMSKKTLFSDFMPLVDKGKNDLVRVEGKNYFVQGYPVLLSDSVALHDAYLGSFTEIYGNLAQDINVESNASSGFRQNGIDYLGSALFDCKPVASDAFVKLTKATA